MFRSLAFFAAKSRPCQGELNMSLRNINFAQFLAGDLASALLQRCACLGSYWGIEGMSKAEVVKD
jgi:hypothetical protein